MKRYCFRLRIRPGAEAEYDRRHAELWPEVEEAHRIAGISNYTLFRRGTEVIGYCECEPDGPTAFGRLADTDVDRRWSEHMADLIVEEVDETGSRPCLRKARPLAR